ncbi:SAM-dependent methyltransferase, partial [Patescibacteria group bacterium]|nr:SAM-dependent methyltransferase [Patescibacteria group bacterium]
DLLPPQKQYFDVITADLSPSTSGVKEIDSYQSYELNIKTLEIASKYLRSGGFLLTKVFEGEEFNEFLEATRKDFNKIKLIKPKATRSNSPEIYYLGRKK